MINLNPLPLYGIANNIFQILLKPHFIINLLIKLFDLLFLVHDLFKIKKWVVLTGDKISTGHLLSLHAFMDWVLFFNVDDVSVFEVLTQAVRDTYFFTQGLRGDIIGLFHTKRLVQDFYLPLCWRGWVVT
jgi:hypothetical protein